MKKKLLILLTIIAVLVTSLLPVAFADGQVTPQFSLINSKDYIDFSPEKLTVNENYIVYTEGNALKVLSRVDNSLSVLNTEGYTGIESISIRNSLLYCILRDDDNAILRIYDLTDNGFNDSDIVGLSLSIYGDYLYVCYGTGYYIYDLSQMQTADDEPLLSQNLSKPFDASATFAANSNSVITIKNGNTVTDIKLSGEKYSFSLPFFPTAVAADDNYVYFMAPTEIHVYSLTTYSEVYSVTSNTSLNTTALFVSLSLDGLKMYASFTSLANGIAVYDITNDGTLSREKLLTTVGATLERLNTPTSVSSCGETVAIADTGNNRVLIPNAYAIHAVGAYKVAVNSTQVYFADADGIKLYTLPDGPVITLITDVHVKSLKTFNNGLLYIDENGVYSYANSSSTLIKDGNYSDVCTSFNGKILYLVSDESISAIYTDTKTTLFSVSLPSVNISGRVMRIECDAYGNLIILSENDGVYKITSLRRLLSGYAYVTDVTLDGITPTDFTVDNDGLYFTSSAPHTLTFVSFDTLNDQGIDYKATFASAYTAPDYTNNTPLTEEAKIYRLIDGNYNLYESPDAYESVTKSSGNVLVYSVDNQDYVHDGNTFCFVIYNGTGRYILKSALTELSTGVPAAKYGSALFSNTVVYKYPDVSSIKLITLNKGARIETISDVCGYDNALWYSIPLNGYVGYVKRADVATSNGGTDILPDNSTDTENYYAEVCFDNTMIYALADEASSIVGILKAGDTVELSAPFNKDDLFTFVTFGETSGYVLTSSLKVPGLSVAQIVALVIIFSAAIIIVLLRILSKKSARNKN